MNTTALNTLNLRVAASQCKNNGVGLPVNNAQVRQDLEAIMLGKIDLPEIGFVRVPEGAIALERPYVDRTFSRACTEIALNTLNSPARYFQTRIDGTEHVVVIFDDGERGSSELPNWSEI